MNIVVIGGVAAGTKAAAKLLRQDRTAQVTVYTIAAFRFRGEMEISSRKAERSRGKKLRFANTAACVVTTGKGAIRSVPEKDAVPALPERAE